MPVGGGSLKEYAIEKVWKGNANFLDKIRAYSATPNAALTPDFAGQLCWDYTNNDIYINTDGGTSTAWTRIYNG